VYCKL